MAASGITLLDGGGNPSGNTVQGNVIGLDVSGNNPLPNGGRGIDVSGGSSGIIGGTATGARNIIAGSGSQGIILHNVATGFTIQGNYIGTDATGLLPRGNTFEGIFVENSPK